MKLLFVVVFVGHLNRRVHESRIMLSQCQGQDSREKKVQTVFWTIGCSSWR